MLIERVWWGTCGKSWHTGFVIAFSFTFHTSTFWQGKWTGLVIWDPGSKWDLPLPLPFSYIFWSFAANMGTGDLRLFVTVISKLEVVWPLIKIVKFIKTFVERGRESRGTCSGKQLNHQFFLGTSWMSKSCPVHPLISIVCARLFLQPRFFMPITTTKRRLHALLLSAPGSLEAVKVQWFDTCECRDFCPLLAT